MNRNLLFTAGISIVLIYSLSAADLQIPNDKPIQSSFMALDIEDEPENTHVRDHVTRRALYAAICASGTFVVASIIYACWPVK